MAEVSGEGIFKGFQLRDWERDGLAKLALGATGRYKAALLGNVEPSTLGRTLRSRYLHDLNEVRGGRMRQEFCERSLTEEDIRSLLGNTQSPAIVDDLIQNPDVRSTEVNGQVRYPVWQFTTAITGEPMVRSDLADIYERLDQYAADPVSADRVMHVYHEELDGTILNALDQPELRDQAWFHLNTLGNGF